MSDIAVVCILSILLRHFSCYDCGIAVLRLFFMDLFAYFFPLLSLVFIVLLPLAFVFRISLWVHCDLISVVNFIEYCCHKVEILSTFIAIVIH